MTARGPDPALAALAEHPHGPALVRRANRAGRRRWEAEQVARAADDAVAEALDRIASPRPVREDGR